MFILEFIIGFVALVAVIILTSLIGRLFFYIVEHEKLGYSLGEHAFSFIPGIIALILLGVGLKLSFDVDRVLLVFFGLEHE